MHGVSRKEDPAARIALRDRATPRPNARAEPFNFKRKAKCAAQIRFAINRLGYQTGAGIDNHEAPHRVQRIDNPKVGPDAVTVDREEKCGWLAAAGLEQIRSVEIHVNGVAERFTIEADTN